MLNAIKALTKAAQELTEKVDDYTITLADLDKFDEFTSAAEDLQDCAEETLSAVDELMYKLEELYEQEIGDDDDEDDGDEVEV